METHDMVVGGVKNALRAVVVLFGMGTAGGGDPLTLVGIGLGFSFPIALVEYGIHQLLKDKKTLEDVAKAWGIAIAVALVVVGALVAVHTPAARGGPAMTVNTGDFSIDLPAGMWEDSTLAEKNHMQLAYRSNHAIIFLSSVNGSASINTIAEHVVDTLKGFGAKYVLVDDSALITYVEQTDAGDMYGTMKIVKCNGTVGSAIYLCRDKGSAETGKVLSSMKCV